MIKVQKQKINISEQNKKLFKKKVGAVVNFIGIARPKNKSGNIKYIEICDRCFCACANHERIIVINENSTLESERWKSIHLNRMTASGISTFVEDLINHNWDDIYKPVIRGTGVIYSEIAAVLSSIIDDKHDISK